MPEQPITFISTTPEEDRIKKNVLQQMENMAELMGMIQKDAMAGSVDPESFLDFKAELLKVYFYYARSKIPSVCVNRPDRTEKYRPLQNLDYYIQNPQMLTLQDAFDYAMLLRDLLEDLGMFNVEKAQIMR